MVSESEDSLRVSDAERDITLKVLNENAAVGRLTLDELEERAGKAIAAKTRGDLAVLTSDLPQEDGTPPVRQAGISSGQQAVPQRKPVRWMVAIMGGSHRRGRFRTVGSINAVGIMGGDDIDLREAEMEGGELTLNLFSVMGGANIYVPDSIEVELGGFALMGGNEVRGSERSPRDGAPIVRVRGFALMGGATIYRLPPQARGLSLREARRVAKAAGRGELPPPS
jgi:Domain of unknown function (DUF1707)/Cell wall-active antibiotics response 4TMS YvqF